jgi:hypothetical protein
VLTPVNKKSADFLIESALAAVVRIRFAPRSMADFHATYAGDMHADPGRCRLIVLMHDDIGIRMLHAFRNAGSSITDLPADPLGMRGVGKSEPQRSRSHANHNFAH